MRASCLFGGAREIDTWIDARKLIAVTYGTISEGFNGVNARAPIRVDCGDIIVHQIVGSVEGDLSYNGGLGASVTCGSKMLAIGLGSLNEWRWQLALAEIDWMKLVPDASPNIGKGINAFTGGNDRSGDCWRLLIGGQSISSGIGQDWWVPADLTSLIVGIAECDHVGAGRGQEGEDTEKEEDHGRHDVLNFKSALLQMTWKVRYLQGF